MEQVIKLYSPESELTGTIQFVQVVDTQAPGEESRMMDELSNKRAVAIDINGDLPSLTRMLGIDASAAVICALFGGIRGSRIEIAKNGAEIDIHTSHPWFGTPLYFSLEKSAGVLTLIINDFFLEETAPRTLGTRIIAAMIFQAAKIPGFDAVRASATRMFFPQEGRPSREVQGYYFFPRMGFDARLKRADDFIDIPPELKAKNLLQIMNDPDSRQWWRENGQTIDVKFKVKSKRQTKALLDYLQEKGISLDTFINLSSSSMTNQIW